MRGEHLRQKREAAGRRRARSAVDVEHEWISFRRIKSRRIDDHAVFLEPFVLPANRLHASQLQRGDVVIEVGEPPRLRGRRVENVELARMARRRPGEGDRSVA